MTARLAPNSYQREAESLLETAEQECRRLARGVQRGYAEVPIDDPDYDVVVVRGPGRNGRSYLYAARFKHPDEWPAKGRKTKDLPDRFKAIDLIAERIQVAAVRARVASETPVQLTGVTPDALVGMEPAWLWRNGAKYEGVR